MRRLGADEEEDCSTTERSGAGEPAVHQGRLANARNAENVQKAVRSSNSMSSHGCQRLYFPTYQKYTGWKFKPKGKGWQPRNYTGYGRGGYKPSKGFGKGTGHCPAATADTCSSATVPGSKGRGHQGIHSDPRCAPKHLSGVATVATSSKASIADSAKRDRLWGYPSL